MISSRLTTGGHDIAGFLGAAEKIVPVPRAANGSRQIVSEEIFIFAKM